MSEPRVIYATVRDGGVPEDADFVLDIECRFSDDQKFAAVTVDPEFEELACAIAEYLSSDEYQKNHAERKAIWAGKARPG